MDTTTARDVSCPVCRAEPDAPCRRPNGDRVRTAYGDPTYHLARTRKAAKA